MSRIGKLPITVPSGVDVAIDGRTVTVKGPKGTLSHTVIEPITVERDDDGTVLVKRPDDERRRPRPTTACPARWSTTSSSASPPATRRSWRSTASATASR